ncbi:hypothetical protein [Humibacillus xanthopallidus]|uniref:Cyclase n=1 Tax=Humibacillus xanthopallidus TaxID=412689 RepID=A0A543I2R2_9MICO|nr:hypothetical protein [Humibacillus xanthopallidus]TQM64875.1 hypothetical protein FBY41_1257 [Humibacillus xanthopallidus]
MSTLHIEHAISDYGTWKAAFDRFEGVRAEAGVRRHTIRRPVDDPTYVLIDLEFDRTDEAARFLGFLRAKVWSTPDNSPALIGSPVARVLETVDSI